MIKVLKLLPTNTDEIADMVWDHFRTQLKTRHNIELVGVHFSDTKVAGCLIWSISSLIAENNSAINELIKQVYEQD